MILQMELKSEVFVSGLNMTKICPFFFLNIKKHRATKS